MTKKENRKHQAVRILHEQYVEGTQKEAIVEEKLVLLCHLTKTVIKGASLSTEKVYIHTRVLKHMYDKRPAQEYDSVIEKMFAIIKYPTVVYENKGGKRGSICFVRKFNDEQYLCSLELIEEEDFLNFTVVTCFRVAKENYLSDYRALWSREGDGPPS